ncbi:hypothetical protein PanWU01x14_061160, partial [Parasponia andersonii]
SRPSKLPNLSINRRRALTSHLNLPISTVKKFDQTPLYCLRAKIRPPSKRSRERAQELSIRRNHKLHRRFSNLLPQISVGNAINPFVRIHNIVKTSREGLNFVPNQAPNLFFALTL